MLNSVLGPVAQRLEQQTHNLLVVGSNPTGPTILFDWISSAAISAEDTGKMFCARLRLKKRSGQSLGVSGILLAGVIVFGAAALQSCAAQKITVEYDQAADFGKYKTFAIRVGELNIPALDNDFIKKKIEADLERCLTAKGLIETSGRSDLNVVYRMGAASKTESEAYPADWRASGSGEVRVPPTEGTLVIDLRDPATHSLVWRGIASEDKSDPAKIQGKLDKMVKKTLAKYPSKTK